VYVTVAESLKSITTTCTRGFQRNRMTLFPNHGKADTCAVLQCSTNFLLVNMRTCAKEREIVFLQKKI
jgi:hypothetical protein